MGAAFSLSEGSWYLHVLWPSCIHCPRLSDALQQVRNWATARVCRKAHHADRAGVYIDAVRLHENGVACGNVERSGTGSAAENETPRLSGGFLRPRGIRSQIDPFEYEVWAGNEKHPFCRKLVWLHLKISGSGVRHRDGAFDVKFTLPTVIEQTECRVAPLLEFCNYEARANRVNRSSGHENDVVW